MKKMLQKSIVIALGAMLTMSSVSYAQTYDYNNKNNQYNNQYHRNEVRNYGPFMLRSMSGRILTVRDEHGDRVTIYINDRTQLIDRHGRPIDYRGVRRGDTIRVYGSMSGSRTLDALVIRDLSISRERHY